MKLLPIILIFIITGLTACGTSFGKKKEFGKLEIYYSKGTRVPIRYVNALGHYFEDHKLVQENKHSIKLTSDHNSFVLKMILNPKLKTFPEDMKHDLELLELDLKTTVFEDNNFRIELCDANFYPLNKKH